MNYIRYRTNGYCCLTRASYVGFFIFKHFMQYFFLQLSQSRASLSLVFSDSEHAEQVVLVSLGLFQNQGFPHFPHILDKENIRIIQENSLSSYDNSNSKFRFQYHVLLISVLNPGSTPHFARNCSCLKMH